MNDLKDHYLLKILPVSPQIWLQKRSFRRIRSFRETTVFDTKKDRFCQKKTVFYTVKNGLFLTKTVFSQNPGLLKTVLFCKKTVFLGEPFLSKKNRFLQCKKRFFFDKNGLFGGLSRVEPFFVKTVPNRF